MDQLNKQNKKLEKKTLLKVNSSVNKFDVFCRIQRNLMKVEIDYDDYTTVSQAILDAIKAINKKYALNLSENQRFFELFAAKKSGNKSDDMPALDYGQSLVKTNLKKFHLQQINQKQNIRIDSQKSIATQIGFDKKPNQKEIKAEKIKFGCMCFL